MDTERIYLLATLFEEEEEAKPKKKRPRGSKTKYLPTDYGVIDPIRSMMGYGPIPDQKPGKQKYRTNLEDLLHEIEHPEEDPAPDTDEDVETWVKP